MNEIPEPSPFALPPRHSVPEEVRIAAERCLESPALQTLLAATDHLALMLDDEGRTLAASQPLLEVLRVPSAAALLGLNPGEVVQCLWASPGTNGCGSAPQCSTCGILLSLNECRSQQIATAHESLLSLSRGAAWTFGEFKIKATPLKLDDRPLIFLSLQDLSDRKRRMSLEQFFFQQVLNLADGLDGTVRILAAEPDSAPLLMRQLADFTHQLTQEVQGRRILIQAENGSLEVEVQETELDEVMENLAAFFRNHDAAHKRHLDLRPFVSERFRVDTTLLLRILVDLVMNAFEATPLGGTVEVEYQRENGERCFLVRNPGVIPANIATQIFQRSFSMKPTGGSGLGTFGLRLLAERYLGGRVDFTTSEEHGTCFYLRLPAPETLSLEGSSSLQKGPFALPPLPEDHERQKLGTVLIVDDTRVIRHLVQSILSKDFKVILAESGQEALALCREQSPDLIVLDVVMPGMDGYSVCRQIKENPKTTNIPIIFLTALTGKTYETQALEAGAIDFITKPINPDVVYARVRNHLEMKQAQDHLKDLSLQDGLTGIANRRAFDRAIEYEWRRGIRSRKPLSVIMGDVDFFKRYNDSLGHQQGDMCLKEVARVFAAAVRRPSDTVARYGGEEFVCVLGDTDSAGAFLVAEKIRAAVEALKLTHPDSDTCPYVTVSLGVATVVPDHHTGFLALVEEADRKLYEAKRSGRNLVAGPAAI